MAIDMSKRAGVAISQCVVLSKPLLAKIAFAADNDASPAGDTAVQGKITCFCSLQVIYFPLQQLPLPPLPSLTILQHTGILLQLAKKLVSSLTGKPRFFLLNGEYLSSLV
jgi:hypothetical protein